MDQLAAPVRDVLAGAVYTAAYACALVLFAWMARRRGFSRRDASGLALAGLIGGLIGANVAQVLVEGTLGKTLLGGIAGGYLTIVFVKRELGIRRATGDLFAVALAGGEAIGRLGCFVAGCCFGKATQVPWAVYDHGTWRHPTQLYLALAATVVFAVLLALEFRARLPNGALFALQGTLLCGSRFAIEFYRDAPAPAFGLTAAQFACIGGVVFFAGLGVRIAWRALRADRARVDALGGGTALSPVS